MTSRPRVYTRIRPLNANERAQDSTHCFYAEKGQRDTLVFVGKDNELVKTRFDYVFDCETTQTDVFGQVGTEIINTLFSGYNATAFAYGQTGSGKTHTMEGGQGDARGITPRLLEAIFDNFSTNPEITDATVNLSLVQIYQERVQDLMQNRRMLEIHMDRTGQYVARDAAWVPAKSVAEALHIYHQGVQQRATSATEMNLVSSRSHMILMVKLQWDEPTAPGSRAQLNLVDLAGSEKLSQSGAVGETMKEAIAINKSLSALGNVVSKLVDQVKHRDRRIHIPYKDSKLTYLLQSSLGGSNLVHFLLALSASSLWRPESTATVEFGKRALQLVLKPLRNPIDYKRLEEMEAMIEKMRTHIRSLEDELKTNKNANAFLDMKVLPQEGDEKAAHRKSRRASRKQRKELKSRTELARIIQNLPETLEDLTSHCVLFPASRAEFRKLDGLAKLTHLISWSQSTYYRAHAAHTLGQVIDQEGRDVVRESGGIAELEKLLAIKEERCKEAACVGLEAMVRGTEESKRVIQPDTYGLLAELVYGYPNQQVTEAACATVASLVDLFPDAKSAFAPHQLVEKLLKTIKESPEEVVHVTKAAITCVGRLAHSDTAMQNRIRELGGIDLLVYNALLSEVGDRDHQLPTLGSYALVNLCCSNEENMQVIRALPEYEEVKCRLMEGLARAFGTNTVLEGFGRVETEEKSSPFPYYGVTVQEKWSPVTCGGRPLFSTFLENPQFQLTVQEETSVTIFIQDVLYEQRTQAKQHNNAVYMGVVVFEGNEELSGLNLKQLIFHGLMKDIARFTSNCENVLHCRLPPSKTPYILVPFTSQRGRCTTFALSAFADRPVNLVQTPEVGWARRIVHGKWNSLTGRGSEEQDWRNNPQVFITARERTRVVFVVSYLSLDEERNERRANDDREKDPPNDRPRLGTRLFKYDFAPDKRYLKAFVPLPQNNTYIEGNSYSSNSYVSMSTTLEPNQRYIFIPFTTSPSVDSWRACIFTDSNEVDVSPLGPEGEWFEHAHGGMWNGTELRVTVDPSKLPGAPPKAGKFCVQVATADAYLRMSVFASNGERLVTQKSYWHVEAFLEVDPEGAPGPYTVAIDGIKRDAQSGAQSKCNACEFSLRVMTELDGAKVQIDAVEKRPFVGEWMSQSTAWAPEANADGTRKLGRGGEYPVLLAEGEDPLALGDDEQDMEGGAESDDYDDVEEAHEHQVQELQRMLDVQKDENTSLQQELKDAKAIADERRDQLEQLQAQMATQQRTPSSTTPRTPVDGGSFARKGSSNSGSSFGVTGTRAGASGVGNGVAGRPVSSQRGSVGPGSAPAYMRGTASVGGAPGTGASSRRTTMSATDAAQKVAALAGKDRAPTASEWARMREELRAAAAALAK